MLSIVKYLSEASTHDDPWAPRGQSLWTSGAKAITHIRTPSDVNAAYHAGEGDARAEALAKAKALAAKKVGEAGTAALSDKTTGAEAAGHALKKGAQAAGEAAGSLGKHAADFAGANPGTAGAIVGGLGAAALYAAARRRKAQAQ